MGDSNCNHVASQHSPAHGDRAASKQAQEDQHLKALQEAREQARRDRKAVQQAVQQRMQEREAPEAESKKGDSIDNFMVASSPSKCKESRPRSAQPPPSPGAADMNRTQMMRTRSMSL